MAFKFILPIFMTIAACIFLCLMTDFRYGKKRVWITLILGMAAIIGFNLAAYLLLRYELYSRISLLVLHLPMLLLFLLLSKYRDFRTVFSWLTANSVVYLITLAGLFFTICFAGQPAADYAGRLAAAILLFFLWKSLRPLYLSMQKALKRGWGIFCLMPLGYYAAAYFFIMRVPMAGRSENLPLQLLMTCVVVAAYCLLFLFFRQMRETMRKENERQLLKTQVKAFERYREEIRQGQQQISILRHDMRHYTVHMAALLREDKTGEALRLTEHLDDALLRATPARRCENDLLNPVLSYYLQRADQEEIEVEANLDLPRSLPVDDTELSIVFANAIENAIHACGRQEPGEPRRIILDAVTNARVTIRISNTYGGEVRFDKHGRPIADGDGYGIGTQSILAFAKKYGAFCRFAVEDGLFCLYLQI
ncbi:GHKL domain-containing protein [Christensenella intestinihominis]|uniref:sensor histidine kinase n=2 Tax=Christensenella intestinihominis TaxID=1851429 RepID=UPI0008372DFE|nr:ATP-binding protein [Christensenella intestinihominis]